MKIKFSSVGESGLIMYLETPVQGFYPLLLSKLIDYLQQKLGSGLYEYIPAYHSLLIEYDENVIDEDILRVLIDIKIQQLLLSDLSDRHRICHRIPVCYDQAFGVDLTEVSDENKITIQSIIDIHSEKRYKVYGVGSEQGAAYLANVDKRIRSGLHNGLRPVETGSIGIADIQTGIYSNDDYRSWKIIGRTPIKLYEPNRGMSNKFNLADEVQFYPISLDEFRKIERLSS